MARGRRTLLWAAVLILASAFGVGGLLVTGSPRAALLTVVATAVLGLVSDRLLANVSARLDAVRADTDPALQRVESLEQRLASMSEAQRRFETALAGIDDGVLAIDGELKITVVNRAAQELLGISEAAVGRALADVVPLTAMNRLVARTTIKPSTEEISLGTNPDRIIDARARPLESGGMVVTMLDVTELRRLETVRRDFVSNVSHELRTPVSVIRASAEALLDGALDERAVAERFADAMSRNAERLTNLVEDLLDLSRIEAGKYTNEPSIVLVRAGADRVLKLLDERASQRGVTVDVQVPDDVTVSADEKAFEQVLVNLVDNAIKYGAPAGRVVLTASPSKGRVRIEVADDGPGIKEADRARVFERFYRVDPGRSRAAGGTGLGLSIARNLVEAMDGKIGVEPARPRGSVFWFDLPAPE